MAEPKRFIGILALTDTGEADLVRKIIESLGKETIMFRPGQPNEAVEYIRDAAQMCSTLVISGHGADGGFHMGSFGQEIDTSLLDGESLMPRIFENMNLNGLDVISSCCATGSKTMTSAILAANAASYIAPPAWPDGHLVVLFLHLFLTQHFYFGNNIEESLSFANEIFVDPGERFGLWNNNMPGTASNKR